MAALRRIEVIWSGTTGLPGVSVFHSLDSVSGALAAIRAFYNSVKAYAPTGVTWTFPGTGDVVDSATGILTGGWTDTDPGSVAATGAGYHAAGVGTFIRWGTGAIVNGRRVKGRTFWAPMGSESFETNGTITAASRTAFITAGNTLWGTGTLNVWHRPPAGTHSGGSAHVVTSCDVPDQVTRLRSRTL